MPEIEVVIESESLIAPPDLEAGSNNMFRHPDGSIWLNTTGTKTGLLKSADQGRTWTSVPVDLPGSLPDQGVAGFYITRDGRLWAVHQTAPIGDFGEMGDDARAFVSCSSDEGRTWETTYIDHAGFAPGAPEDPYTSIGVTGCHPNFIERPDGTVMFSASMRYDDWDDYGQADQTRPGIRDVMVRTTDGGRTWGDPTIVHQHATETAYAVDPKDPDHIIAATRIQRYPLAGEDAEAIKKEISGVPLFLDASHPWVRAGNSPATLFCYKNGMLIESTDGGRSFRERPGGLYGYGSYRWSMVWTEDNILVLVSFAGQEAGDTKSDSGHVARISLDGGGTWLDGTPSGTTAPNKAKKFAIVPARADGEYSGVLAATVQLGPNRFMSTCRYKKERTLKARFWHLEDLP